MQRCQPLDRTKQCKVNREESLQGHANMASLSVQNMSIFSLRTVTLFFTCEAHCQWILVAEPVRSDVNMQYDSVVSGVSS